MTAVVAVLTCIHACNPFKVGNVDDSKHIEHLVVYQEEGMFAAWPANGGMWAWGDEVLVCFTQAEHKGNSGHTYDVNTSGNMFARSLDGGLSWSPEGAYEQGITGYAMDHRRFDRYTAPLELEKPIDFHHPGFAFLFQRETNQRGPSHFYFSYNKGKLWHGPYIFPELDSSGITNRTDYLIDSKNEMLVFMSVGHGRTAVARTTDGALTWQLISYVGPDFTQSEELHGRNDYSLMPSTVRLSEKEILTAIRHREGDDGRVWITSYLSIDNGYTWTQLDDPVNDHVNSPPALLRLKDGRLMLVYIFRKGGWENGAGREETSSLCARISEDNGRSWSEEIVLRANEGANSDVGYPRAVLRADGKVVITYYWNHALDHQLPPYRYIACTILDPAFMGNID